MVFYQDGNVDQALTQYDKVLTINPQYPDAYLSRGSIRAQRRQFADAITDDTRAIEIYQRQISELEGEAQKSESIGDLSVQSIRAVYVSRRQYQKTPHLDFDPVSWKQSAVFLIAVP